MHLKILILVISFAATAGLPVPQNNDSTRGEASWDYSSQKANQAADKTELTKEVDGLWKSSLESSDLYAGDASQGRGPLAGDLRRKLSLESQRLHARLAQELRELRERLAAALAAHPAHPSPGPAPRGLAALALRFGHALDADARQLCSRLTRCARGPETAGGPGPEQGPGCAEGGAERVLGDGERRLSARLAELRAELAGVTGGRGDASEGLRREAEAFGARVRSRAQALRAGLARARSLGEGLSGHVDQHCRSSLEENRLFVDSLERQLEALGQEQGEVPGEVPSVSPISTGSLGEDFSPKLNALLQDILQTLN